MARGNRRGDIVRDDADRRRFVETLREVVESSGWELHAWVLMGNHYHLLFKTPQPNLVHGMSWFQTTWTRRFNTRHKLWGRLYGDRDKAKPVEEGDYLTGLLPTSISTRCGETGETGGRLGKLPVVQHR